jgi:hypothetical protein
MLTRHFGLQGERVLKMLHLVATAMKKQGKASVALERGVLISKNLTAWLPFMVQRTCMPHRAAVARLCCKYAGSLFIRQTAKEGL